MYKEIVGFIREIFQVPDGVIPLHEPRFVGNEQKYVNECLASTFVSSVGAFIHRFEESVAGYVGSRAAVAVVNGTAALHSALLLAGVTNDDEVITQPLTFVATINAIAYTGAAPIFLDVDADTMGLSPQNVRLFLETNTQQRHGVCMNRTTGKRIHACVPMHTFGHPCRIDEIKAICDAHNIVVIEDAAESLGSLYKGRHTGTFGLCGVLSFNGNKTVTTGGGGMIVSDDDDFARQARHLTKTAKISHKWEYIHDCIGYNYRLPNINAALGCAQMEQLPEFLEKKRHLAVIYADFFENIGVTFFREPEHATSNYWLNAIILKDRQEREAFLKYSNQHGVLTRPIWRLMHKLPMYAHCQRDSLAQAEWLEDRIVNIPSSPRMSRSF